VASGDLLQCILALEKAFYNHSFHKRAFGFSKGFAELVETRGIYET